ncbi:MAG: GGDEF domain-containing protein [Spirochaetales bacterium]|nr:GGDEF domain-containing protein [Spirochaetales bacterium]
MNKDDDFLKKVMILEECSLQEKKQFISISRPLILKKDDIIFKQGDVGRQLYIVEKGLVGSYTKYGDGSQIDLARYSPGMFLGVMPLVEALPGYTTCYAVTDVELLLIDFIDFHRFIWTNPVTGVKILKAILRYMICDLHEADKFLATMAMWGEKARHRAIIDELTGLYNKRFFEESLELTIMKSKQNKNTFSLIMFDVDDFRKINQTLGRTRGDEILRNIAYCIKSACRENAVISRLGGDEFAVLLPDLSVTDSLQVAKRFKNILTAIWKQPLSTGVTLDAPVTASIGIAEFPDHGKTASVLKEAADKALYSSKKAGKNTIMCAEKI